MYSKKVLSMKKICFNSEALADIKKNFNDSNALRKYIKNTQILINGKFVNSKSGKTFKTFNPSNENLLCEVQEGDSEDINAAAVSSRNAFENGPWRKLTDFERGKLLYKFADVIEANRVELSVLDALDNGKPYKIANELDTQFVIDLFRYYAGWADKNTGKLSSHSKMKSSFCYTVNEPVGVVGAIIPWNYPLLMASWKLGACLAMGNTCILKPAEQTPLSVLRLGELALEAGIPEGVLNIVPGYGPTAGRALCQHPLVDKVSFTGSTEIGLEIMRTSHIHRLKRITLELGGKSPNIILNDSNMDTALEQATNSVFFNTGQNCIAGSRLFVQERVYDEFVEKITKYVKNQVVDYPFEEKADQGPLVDNDGFLKHKKYVDLGIKEGAKMTTGQNQIKRKGYWVEPAIFCDVKDDMKIAQEEIFSPVMSILKFKTLDEVIERANNTSYGLGAGIVGNNINEVNYLINALKVGNIYVNTYNAEDVATPFGGVKNSGVGRDLGELGLQQYVEPKTVIINNII